jgi:hypothetical protein
MMYSALAAALLVAAAAPQPDSAATDLMPPRYLRFTDADAAAIRPETAVALSIVPFMACNIAGLSLIGSSRLLDREPTWPGSGHPPPDAGLLTVGAALTGVGLVLAPSLGRFIAGDKQRAYKYAATRLVLFGIAAPGLALVATPPPNHQTKVGVGIALLGPAAVALIVLSLVDTGTTWRDLYLDRAERAAVAP